MSLVGKIEYVNNHSSLSLGLICTRAGRVLHGFAKLLNVFCSGINLSSVGRVLSTRFEPEKDAIYWLAAVRIMLAMTSSYNPADSRAVNAQPLLVMSALYSSRILTTSACPL